MAFEKIDIEIDEKCRYWKGDEIGEFLEGNICQEIKDRFGNIQLVVERGEDEYGNPIQTALPTNVSIRRYYSKLNMGDYIRVTLVDIKPPYKGGKHPQKIFRIQKDPERFKDYS